MDHTKQCSGVTPEPALMSDSWQHSGDLTQVVYLQRKYFIHGSSSLTSKIIFLISNSTLKQNCWGL